MKKETKFIKMKGEGKMKNNEEANKVNILPLSNDYLREFLGKEGMKEY